MSDNKIKNIMALGSSKTTDVPNIEPHKQSLYDFDHRDYIPFGSDNLFPQAVMALVRKSVVLRGILSRKKVFTIGGGIVVEEGNEELGSLLKNVNADEESITQVVSKLETDHGYIGNAYMEIVTDSKQSFVNLYHHDHTTVRRARSDDPGFIIHGNWYNYESEKKTAKNIPEYPNFEQSEDGYWRAMYHFKDYEPEFNFYGIMDWLAGMGVGAIAYKTDKWNISRLDNAFSASGMLVVDGEFSDPELAKTMKDGMIKEYTGEGNTGKVMFMVKSLGGGKTEFIEIGKNEDGDWTKLHDQSSSDLIVATNWFKSLSGLPEATGFDTERVLNEYQVAMSTVIGPRQSKILDVISKILNEVTGVDTSGMSFANKPPISDKPDYMKVWEARKEDGLNYDEEDPDQNIYIGDLKKRSIRENKEQDGGPSNK